MWKAVLLAAVLFYVLTPGVFLTLPPGGSLMTVRLTHAAVFGVVWTLTHKMAWKLLSGHA
jgi:hypothetical protein